MDPSPQPPRRGPVVLAVALSVALVAAVALAGWSFMRGRDGGPPGSPEEARDPLRDILEEVLGGGVEDLADLLGCVDPLAAGSLEAPAGAVAEQVRVLADQVEELRELGFAREVEPEFLSDAEIERRLREEVREQYPEEAAEADERILEALGAIPPGTDLRRMLQDLQASQVSGFYDPRTEELVVRTGEQGVGGLERLTLVHELEHALADQRFGLPLPETRREGTEDEHLAALALVEGDAMLTMELYASSLSIEEQLELADPSAYAEARAGLSDLPHYLRRELFFPYETGREFVCSIYQDGGWRGVDRAYGDPPSTTAQVLFPDRYEAGEGPEDPEDPGDLGHPWSLESRRQVGAAALMWLFEAPGDDTAEALGDPEAAARAWAGGELTLWVRGEESAVGISIHERPGEEELCDAVADWYSRLFSDDDESPEPGAAFTARGEAQSASLVCEGDNVRLGIAPGLPTARRLIR